MNRYRFYEILQAYKNGEDISGYVPKNPAEAQLINNLLENSSGSKFINIAEFDNRTEEAGYQVGGSTTPGTGQAILDAFNAGIRLVRIEDYTVGEYNPGKKYMNVIGVMDCDTTCISPFYNFVIAICADINVDGDVVIEDPTLKYYIYTK